MRKQKLRVFLAVACFVLSSTVAFAQKFKVDQYFPESTQIFVAISNVKELGDAWKRTKLYETLSAPQSEFTASPGKWAKGLTSSSTT